MKRKGSFIFVLLWFVGLVYAGEPQITSVVVYQDRAQVTRSVSLPVQTDDHEVVFANLPRQIQSESLRTVARGSAKIQISGIEVKTIFLQESPDARVKELEAQIQSLADDIAAVDSQSGVLKAQKDFLDSVRAGYSEKLSKEFTVHPAGPTEFAQMVEYLGKSLNDLNEQSRKLELQKRELAKKLDAKKRELSEVQSNAGKDALSAIVGFKVEKPGDLQLDLSYIIVGASWVPVYDARLQDNGTDLDLSYRGVVTQNTGEDWNNVDLTLSTARPAIAGNPPELLSWQIQFKEREKQWEVMEQVPAGQAMYNATAPAEVPAPALQAPQVIQKELTSVLFRIPEKKTILSDGSPHSVDILLLPFKGDSEYMTIPKLSNDVYLRSQITNTSETPLLPGRVNIFLGNNFAGNSTMPETAPGQEFRLYFGVDPDIKVKREDLAQSKEGGAFSKNRKNFSYKIEVQNFKPAAKRVVVLDQIPVSKNAELKVETDKITPDPVEQSPQGLLKWILELQPQEKKTVNLEFHVSFPKDKEVAGM